MRTKDLERELGLAKHTFQYYEREGFIHPKRDENGYRNYSDEDIQTLQLVKFLRNLDVSIDDVKAILNGELDFHECLRVNQIHLNNQTERMSELKKTMDRYVEKDLPLIPALEKIQETSKHWKLGIQKTTNTVSLGRKLTKSWCIRQLFYGLYFSLIVSVGMGRFFFMFFQVDILYQIIIYILGTLFIELICIAAAFRSSAPGIDSAMDQSVEFLKNGIRYYQFTGYLDNLKYFMTVLFGKEEKMVHFCCYEEIQEVEILAKRRYMNLGSPIAYETYGVDFVFKFQDGKSFYFLWPTLLDDDAKYIAIILKEKVTNIKDKHNVLYAFENGINLNDYLIGI